MSKPSIFISYSHKDKAWKDYLVSHLGVLSEQGLLTFWEDRQVGAGEDWYEKIQDAVNAANVAILLVSANSLTSKFILCEEVKRLLQRRDNEGLIIFPVIIKSCPWQHVDWLSRMQVRPLDGKPLASFVGNRRNEELSNIATEIHELFKNEPSSTDTHETSAVGFKRINISHLPITGSDLFGRKLELQQLDEAWSEHKTNILSLVAWGGVGKSALVNYWLAQKAQNAYQGASRVYAWSFYSQGTSDRSVSSDQFIAAALAWFGDKHPDNGSPWEKGERLAHLIGAQRALLVLDGLEPLQHPPGPSEGQLKDLALQSLLRQLVADNKGLCIISTRIAVADFSSFEGHTAKRIDLEHLSPEAGTQVLRAQGVKGDQAELEQASREFNGHSLALTLLGSYLTDVYEGDVSRRKEVSNLKGDVRYGGHAQKVMSSYEKWLGEGPELAVLRILGLFNLPADKYAIAALRTAPVIQGLTDKLFHFERRTWLADLFSSKKGEPLSEEDWNRILARLRRAKLLAPPNLNQPGTLDTHPLVREHFGQQLKRANRKAWREGNNRLYEHLRHTTKMFPDTIEMMTSLYAAVTHGCEAGRHQEVFDEVYSHRILRISRKGEEFFSTKKLGAFAADLAALTSFFEKPWQQPVRKLRQPDKASVLAMAGFDLMTLGRLEEAVQPMQAQLKVRISLGNWENASSAAYNLSENYLTIGDLPQALTYAQQSIELAIKSGDGFAVVGSQTILANALHQAGRFSEAEIAFHEAEALQRDIEPEIPYLYSKAGYEYCDLLMSQGKSQEVLVKVGQLQKLVSRAKGVSLTDFALIDLYLGIAYLLKARRKVQNNFTQATDHLNRAVDGLRQAGEVHYVPRALMARAKLYRVKGELARAQSDLDEAMVIAIRGSMGLHQADCHLEYAQMSLAQGEKEKAREWWMKAKEMIERLGYHRRDKDIEAIEKQLRSL